MERVVKTIQELLDHQTLKPAHFSSLSNFLIEGILGSGNFATVYKAKTNQGHPVALKVLHEHISTDEKLETKFIREVISLAKFNHPGIPRLTEEFYLKKEQKLCMIMEYIQGITLNEIIANLDPPFFKVKSGLIIMQQLAGALAYAHEKGVIHRDIKPQNIMVTVEGVAKIMDFGIAKIVSKGSTGSTIFAYTPRYVAPERMQLSIADERSDIYSLGVTFYEMLTGYHPAEVFHLTANTIELIEHDIPQADIREKLRLLENKHFTDEDSLFQALTNAIGLDASNQYIHLILSRSQTGASLDQARLIYFHTQAPVPQIGRFRDIPEDLSQIIKKTLDKNAENRFQSCPELAEALGRIYSAISNSGSFHGIPFAVNEKKDDKKTAVEMEKTLVNPAQHTMVMLEPKNLSQIPKPEKSADLPDKCSLDQPENVQPKKSGAAGKRIFYGSIIMLLLAAGIGGGWMMYKPNSGKLKMTMNLDADRIFIDGKPYKPTADGIYELTIGAHTIEVEKEGYAPFNQIVDVDENEQKTVDVQFHSLPLLPESRGNTAKPDSESNQEKNDIFEVLDEFK